MSGRIVGEVLDHAPQDLTPLELNVLVALAEQARQADRIATHKTTREALAHRCRTTPATIKNVLRILRDRGLIEPLLGNVHRGIAQHYRIPKLTPDHRSATWKGDHPVPHNGEPKGDDTIPLRPVDNPPTHTKEGGSGTPRKGGPPDPPTRKHLSPVDKTMLVEPVVRSPRKATK